MSTASSDTPRAVARDLLTLAGPVALGFLGTNLMTIVDTAMVRPLGHVAVGAVGLGGAFYSFALLSGIGLLLGVDRVAAVARGAGRDDDIARALVGGVTLALGAAIPLILGLRVASSHIASFGVAPELVPVASEYLRTLCFALAPALLFFAARQTLQAIDDTGAATVILFAANGVNALAAWSFVHGRLGMPRLGAAGVGYATLVSQSFMALSIYVWCARKNLGLRRVGLLPDPATLGELLRLGGPASAQLVLEVGVFSCVALLAARIDAVSAAAHQAVMQIASFTFMVPLGLSVSGSVRVGQSIGREDFAAARRFGNTAVALGAGYMVLSGITLTLAWRPILGVFVTDPGVLILARRLLAVAALFQLFDGMQVTLAGVLRGAGDTTSSMLANLLGHWSLGLPVGCALAFWLGWGATGLWVGLAVGLGAVALGLLVRWRARAARMVHERRA